jgi:hypothetical protein
MTDPKDALCAKMLAQPICPSCGKSVLVKMSDYSTPRSQWVCPRCWDIRESDSSWLRSVARWMGRAFIPQGARVKETAARIIEGMEDGSVVNDDG